MFFSFACASRYKIGDLVVFANDAALTVDRQIQCINGLIVSVSFTAIYSVVLIGLSPFLALVAVLLAFVVIGVQQKLLPGLRVAARQLNSAQVELSKEMTEKIQALRLLHTFGTQQRSIDEVTRLLWDVQISFKNAHASSISQTQF
jgi:ATP-binding cassette subfamily B protein/subfamily B ATP-binding cassette protein MsbA